MCRARAGLGLWPDQKLRASSLQKARENRSSRAGLGLGPRPVAPLLFTTSNELTQGLNSLFMRFENKLANETRQKDAFSDGNRFAFDD